MLHQRGNSRGGRGQSSDRSRGRGGRGRGASTPSEQGIDAFEQERLANAAKREQRGQSATVARGRGGILSALKNKGGQTDHTAPRGSRSSKESSPAPSNPFTSSRSASPSLPQSSAQSAMNPFASKPKSNAPINPFATTTSSTSKNNPFGVPYKPSAPGGFGTPSQPASSLFGAPSQPAPLSVFGTPTTSVADKVSNPFSNTTITSAGGFGAPSAFVWGSQLNQSGNATTSSQPQTVIGFGMPSSSTITNVPPNPFLEGSGNSQSKSLGVFGAPSVAAPSNPFGGLSSTVQSASSSDSGAPSAGPVRSKPNKPFAATLTGTSEGPSKIQSVNPFGAPSTSGAVVQSSTNPFGAASQSKQPTFGTSQSDSFPLSSKTTISQFAPSAEPAKVSLQASLKSKFDPASLGAPSKKAGAPPFGSTASSSVLFSGTPKSNVNSAQSGTSFSNITSASKRSQLQTTKSSSKNPWGEKLKAHLAKEGIFRPTIPVPNPGDPRSKAEIEKFFHGPLKSYRAKARKSLMQAGLIDDPDKPKKLSEAIAFKGTCDTMCPFKEIFERIIEGPTAVANLEKRRSPDGSMWPAIGAMVKKHSRSAAGDEAPLPEDVRSPKALRMTLDYLLYNILDEADELRKVHGFLWDRTRGIRRDFVFQSSFNAEEHGDYVYCLELIARFHVVALHQMSKADLAASDFSEQQEREQLAKTLLSLIHEYDDCRAQGVECDNEPEFRAYYTLFHAENPNIMESIQDWEAKFWEESEEIAIAISLVEALQNVWDVKGPQKPYASTDVALNAFTNFFTIVEDKETSYTMACFAEMHFNRVRKAALKTILAAYRKQRDQTKEWTLSKLNEWLRFDEDGDIIAFGEAYGLRYDEGDDGEQYLSFEGQESPSDPFPPPKQQHSFQLVERKRGNLKLVELIDSPTYESDNGEEDIEKEKRNGVEAVEQSSDEDSLFVKDNTASSSSVRVTTESASVSDSQAESDSQQIIAPSPFQNPNPPATAATSGSIFDRVETVTSFGSDFFTRSSAPTPGTVTPVSSTTLFPPAKEPSPPLTKPTPSAPLSTAPPFTFSQHPPTQITGEVSNPPFSLGNYTVTKAPVTSTSRFSLGNFEATKTTTETATLASSDLFRQTSTPKPSPMPSPLSGNSSPVALPSSLLTTQASLTSPSVASSPAPTATPQVAAAGLLSQQATLSIPQASALSDRDWKFNNFAEWYALGEEGIVDQFKEFMLEGILQSTMEQFTKEEGERVAREAHAEALNQADLHRLTSLYKKYATRWRNIARRRQVRKHREETQKAMAEMAAASRAKKQALSASLVDDFRASTQSSSDPRRYHREQSLDSLLDAPSASHRASVQSADANPRRPIRKGHPSSLYGRSLKSVDLGPSTNSKKRTKVDDPFRRSLADDPSYLSGESRMHLLKNYHEDRRQVSGVQTDYFRLKARGIHTMPDGSPLASSVATEQLWKKRSFDALHKEDSQSTSNPYSKTRSLSASRFDTPPLRNVGSRVGAADIKVMKANAREIVAREKEKEEMANTAKKRRSVDMEEEELFERAKRVKASMDEGAAWYREQLEKDSHEAKISARSYGSY